MNNSNFFKIFKTFNKKEARDFDKYLRCIHPGEKVAYSVFKYLHKYHPAFEDPERLDIEYAGSKLFGGEKGANSKKVSNALSELSGWAKEFLLVEAIKKESVQKELMLCEILKSRKLEWDFLKSSAKLEQLVETQKLSCIADYQFNMAASLHAFYQEENRGVNNGLNKLNKLVHTTDIAYILSKIKMACVMESYNHFGSNQTEIKDMEFVLQIAERYLEDAPFLQLYYAVYKLVFQKTNEDFATAVNLLRNYAPMLSAAEVHDLLSLLRNYLGKRVARGDEAIWEKGHELNEISLASGFFKREKLTGVAFSNIVNIACGVNKIEWAQQFIDEIGPLLAASIQDDTVAIAKVCIYAAQNDYEGMLTLSNRYHFRDVKLNIIARAFTLKAYYLLRKTPEEILFQCNAFTSFLNRQTTLNKDFLDPISNFIKMVKLLTNPNKTKKAYLMQLEKHKPALMYKWLKEMSPAR